MLPEEPMSLGLNKSGVDNWGAKVVALLDQLDLTDWEQMDISDVGEWIHQLRHKESEYHERYWNGEA